MPEMNGLDLAAQLLAIRPDLPIIITSGYVRPEDKLKADRLGVRDIVLKPNTVAEMGELIRERLDGLKVRSV
jgi:CheY-like chemotaxis protein